MKRTGAWLTAYALEQIGARFTFGIPGVHTTELYDALNSSNRDRCRFRLLRRSLRSRALCGSLSGRFANCAGSMIRAPP